MKERLQKILSARGVASRRRAEEMILAGKVSVNGAVAALGDSADPETDDIRIEGKALPEQGERVYLMLHKPRGYVTTLSDEKGRRDVSQLVADCAQRVYPVGRLDYDSEGLLLLTNDGDLAQRLMHPSHEVSKTYEVWVTGFHNAAEALLGRAIVLDGYRIRRPQVKCLWSQEKKAKFSVTIHEGRNRQVRRMCAEAGLTVTRLKRVSEGPVKLGTLPVGKWRYLTEEELEALKR